MNNRQEGDPFPEGRGSASTGHGTVIADSIVACGFATPVLIDENSMLLAGHGRLEAAKLLGLERIPAISFLR
jgi:ParB-like chromosome segregation protein Spo0J